MAIQILEVPHRPSTGEKISKGLGNVINMASEYAQHYNKQKMEEQQYKEENETYRQLTGRNLSKNPKTREMEIEYALKGQHEFQKENTKYRNKSEETAAKLAGEKEIHKNLISFADRLEENNPNSPVHKTIADIYRTDLPMDQKTAIVKSLTGVDPFKVEQQKRLQLDSVLKRYNSRLKELDDEIKNIRNPNSTGAEEVAALRKQRMSLRNERDQLLDFRALNGMEDEMEDEATNFEDLEDEEIEPEEGPKVVFNPKNKEHKAKAEQLYKKFKDKEKVRKILSKEFKGL